jgi:hypothetical protein
LAIQAGILLRPATAQTAIETRALFAPVVANAHTANNRLFVSPMTRISATADGRAPSVREIGFARLQWAVRRPAETQAFEFSAKT